MVVKKSMRQRKEMDGAEYYREEAQDEDLSLKEVYYAPDDAPVKSYLTQIIYLTDSAPRIPSYDQTRRAGSRPGDLGREGPEV